MSKVGLVFLLITHIFLVALQAMEEVHYSEAPTPMELKNHREVQLSYHKSDKISTTSKEEGERESKEENAMAPDYRRMGKHHSSSSEMAGGGVIIGGLVSATFAVVFCYIRVTRKKDSDGVAHWHALFQLFCFFMYTF